MAHKRAAADVVQDIDAGFYTVVFTGVMDYEPNVDGVCWFAEHYGAPWSIRDLQAATTTAVHALFADPVHARRVSAAAAAWVRKQWRWERMYERLDALLGELGISFDRAV